MAVFSYLAHPKPGQGRELAARLRDVPGCEVVPSEGYELMVLVTETGDESEEKRLQERLDSLDDLESLAMVFGHDGPEPPEDQL